ncbi:hypothetical protein [Sphingomicrobium astaxanthinifaciens]|uniref:hypothetical protein n=1 Tax=Sphingomicrobium astaxanthinifaciens TaxID=1227949 RepID=UPI001FCA4DEB|nr:hypothetical protein [Sphingomicrobium astaxanthinifaciens]MCJ7421900.1 hypothetical protein [Sphingomicrobium astaxanthinifaciens]
MITKTLMLMAGAMTLAACDASTGNPDETDSADADMVVEENAAADGPGMPGTYTIYNAEGELQGTATNMADGTYSWTDAEGTPAAGTGMWENRDGKMCIKWTEEGADMPGEENCWTRGEAGEDGRVVWTSDDPEQGPAYVDENVG